MASHKNGVSQLHYCFSEVPLTMCIATPMLIEPTPTVRHRKVIGISLWSGKTLTLRSHDHESESYIYDKLKKFLLKITYSAQCLANRVTFGHFFARCAILVRHHFLWVSYLSISGVVFVTCHFYKVPLFSKQVALKGDIFVGCL